MLTIYSFLTGLSAPLLHAVLRERCRKGKEDPARLPERTGVPGKPRPPGKLAWIHAASVGEAQSALILIGAILKKYPDASVLLTTGTATSARLAEKRLPPRALHQYCPLDHPAWVNRFLDHWRPDAALWMESELWPNMLEAVRKRRIPAALVNARLSPGSFRRWRLAPRAAEKLLSAFSLCLAQTQEDAAQFHTLGAKNAIGGGNLKYAASPLPCDPAELARMRDAVAGRPVWLYASTHEGEEEMACRIHRALEPSIPGLLTVIVPRHPERGAAVAHTCEKYGPAPKLRSAGNEPPSRGDRIYIADTLGELGLFYRLCPAACIGRSFSDDGGGGHNPIEAAQLGCAVLHGPAVGNLGRIYDEFDAAGAALRLDDEAGLEACLKDLLTNPERLSALRDKGAAFCARHASVLGRTEELLAPVLSALGREKEKEAGMPCP